MPKISLVSSLTILKARKYLSEYLHSTVSHSTFQTFFYIYAHTHTLVYIHTYIHTAYKFWPSFVSGRHFLIVILFLDTLSFKFKIIFDQYVFCIGINPKYFALWRLFLLIMHLLTNLSFWLSRLRRDVIRINILSGYCLAFKLVLNCSHQIALSFVQFNCGYHSSLRWVYSIPISNQSWICGNIEEKPSRRDFKQTIRRDFKKVVDQVV